LGDLPDPDIQASEPERPHVTQSEKYTAAAYLVVFLGVLVYVVIIGSKLQRLQREVEQLVALVKEKRTDG
jgi:CcmD family protein